MGTLQSEINVTPLVDVCLVLLIIFMVVTPILVNGKVDLPTTRHGDPANDGKRQIAISVQQDGTIVLDALAIRTEQLATALQQAHERHPDLPVVVRGDKRVLYGEVVGVLDACRAAGFQNVGLISRPKED